MNGSNLDDVTQGHEGRLVPNEERTPAEYPKRIGRYRVEEVLGKGNFGPVYLAHDEQVNRPVAVKLPHARLIAHPEVATVVDALHYAPKQGIVHRDIKPGDILIGNDGKPFVIDFGQAFERRESRQGDEDCTIAVGIG